MPCTPDSLVITRTDVDIGASWPKAARPCHVDAASNCKVVERHRDSVLQYLHNGKSLEGYDQCRQMRPRSRDGSADVEISCHIVHAHKHMPVRYCPCFARGISKELANPHSVRNASNKFSMFSEMLKEYTEEHEK